jgi:hypothetical protein
MDILTLLLSLFVVVLFIRYSARLIPRGNCLVVYQNGQASKVVKTSPVILLLPFMQTSKLVETDKKCRAIPYFYDDRKKQIPLVLGTFEYHVSEPLRAAGNDNLSKDLESIMVNALQRVLIDATISQCLNEKSFIEQRALEIANLKSTALGVVLTSLQIDSFPAHRRLLFEITAMPYMVYYQIVQGVQ